MSLFYRIPVESARRGRKDQARSRTAVTTGRRLQRRVAVQDGTLSPLAAGARIAKIEVSTSPRFAITFFAFPGAIPGNCPVRGARSWTFNRSFANFTFKTTPK